jgi:hypothetical protein
MGDNYRPAKPADAEPVQYVGAINHEATVREMAARAEAFLREKEALRELLEAVRDKPITSSPTCACWMCRVIRAATGETT